MRDPAREIVAAVLDELDDRNGFDAWWDGIELPIQREIRLALLRRVRDVTDTESES